MTPSPSEAAPWTPEPRLFETWNVERTGATIRITQDGHRRITEQGNLRVIERLDIKWINESTSSNPWTKE